MDEFYSLEVAEVRRETAKAVSVALVVPPRLAAQFVYRPGQFLNVRATVDGSEVRRSYSICSGPDDRFLRIAIKAVEGGVFSTWVGRSLKPRDRLDVTPPSGRFALPPGDGRPRHILLFAAGSGITPVISIAAHALHGEPEATVTLVYGNRSIDEIMFRERLENLKDRHLGRFAVINVLSRNDDTDVPLLTGRIGTDKLRALARHAIALDKVDRAFVCGPGSMIRDVRDALLELGFPRNHIHHEFFAAGGGAYRGGDASSTRDAPAGNAGAGTDQFEIIAVLDGIRHRFWARPGEAVIDAALRAGVRAPYACKGGMCCTCRAHLVEGEAPMATNYSLEPWELAQGYILTCQAVPSSRRIVVDYDRM